MASPEHAPTPQPAPAGERKHRPGQAGERVVITDREFGLELPRKLTAGTWTHRCPRCGNRSARYFVCRPCGDVAAISSGVALLRGIESAVAS